MEDIEKEFNTVVDVIKTTEKNNMLTDNDKLDMYKYYKQATVGDCNIDKPWSIYFEACAKWNAWNSIRNMSKENAMIEYINLYKNLLQKN
jgi:diazepam-binding inhibitor (GABA receptor modulating acyl-CoA-binding protein)